MEHLAIEKEERTERLILRGCGDMLIHSEVREKLAHVMFAHVARMVFFVEKDELLDPADIGFFGSEAIMLAADGLPDWIEEFGLAHDVF